MKTQTEEYQETLDKQAEIKAEFLGIKLPEKDMETQTKETKELKETLDWLTKVKTELESLQLEMRTQRNLAFFEALQTSEELLKRLERAEQGKGAHL